MNEQTREKYLRLSLVVIGLVFIAGIWILGQVWPSGWLWHEGGRNHYHEMIMVVYATLGVFLILASRAPSKNLSLFGSLFGQVSLTPPSWLSNPSITATTLGICGAMSLHFILLPLG